MDHSYEEIRSVVLYILTGREKVNYDPNQYQNLYFGVAEVFKRREVPKEQLINYNRDSSLSHSDGDKLLEIFWDLFRQGIITLGINDSNRVFPFFRVSEFGKKIMEGQNPYWFHDVTTYENLVKGEISDIDPVTLIYLMEAAQAFKAGCILSSTVMLGVATEHTFLLLMEKISNSPTHSSTFASVDKQRTILQKINKFKTILDQQIKTYPVEIKEDIDTHFSGITSIIRNFRNQSGHPTGKIIGREQAFILLQLFIPYCKKMYQLIKYYS